MKRILSSVLILILFICYIETCILNPKSDTHICESYCYSDDEKRPQKNKYSSKTAYQFVKGEHDGFDLNGCKPVKFWLLSRHGTRYADADFLSKKVEAIQEIHKKFIENHEEYRKFNKCWLCKKDYDLLKSWSWDENITADMDERLHEQGWTDLLQIGKSYKPLIEKITKLEYNSTVFHFRHTDTQRTEKSFRAFVTGLFDDVPTIKLPPIPTPDILLRPYDNCDAFDTRNKDKKETKLFEETEEFEDMIKDVSAKLGYSRNIEKEIIKSIWDLCRYEQSWQITNSSPWCVLFSHKHNDVLEYSQDLKYFYKSGYAHPENEFLMCEAMQDMLHKFQDKSSAKVTTFFSHSTALLLFNVMLEMGRDSILLTANNYFEQSNRLWRSSQIDPFASNLAAVKYSCSDGVDRIMFYRNEILLKPHWCNFDGVCTLKNVLEKYYKFFNVNCSQIYCK